LVNQNDAIMNDANIDSNAENKNSADVNALADDQPAK
jgi:hypothetical protein